MMKKIFFIFLLCILLCLTLFIPSAFAANDISVFLNGEKLDFPIQDPTIVNDRTLVPMRTIFEALGAEVDWIDESKTAIAKKDSTVIFIPINSQWMQLNEEKIQLDVPAQLINEKTMVPVRAVSEAFWCKVGWIDELRTVTIYTDVADKTSNSLSGVSIDNSCRYPNFDGKYNAVYVFNNNENYFGMERIEIEDTQGEDYAEIVNHIAALLPNVQIYNLLVPTPAEFYAPENFKTNYLASFQKIYAHLLPKIIDVNAFTPLNEHLDEKLYFFTDHHWTHRGSYYAYTAFADAIGQPIDPLSTFDTANFDGYVGSWAKDGFLGDQDGIRLMEESPDYFERFLPKVAVEGMAYLDQKMEKPLKPIALINIEIAHYDTFLEGDLPLSVFKTGTKNGKKLAVIKESYGNAFTTWAVNHYEEIYVIDYRGFNQENQESFSLTEFYEQIHFDDLLVISYPISVAGNDARRAIAWLAK